MVNFVKSRYTIVLLLLVFSPFLYETFFIFQSSFTLDPTCNNTLFDTTLDFYDHMTNDMLACIVDMVAVDVQARSMPYRRDK